MTRTTVAGPRSVSGRRYYESALHAVLVDKLPQFVRYGRIDTEKLGADLGLSSSTVSRWMLDNRLSRGAAKRLLLLDGQITKEDLLPFLFA